MSTPFKRRFDSHQLTTSVGISAPASRMVVAQAYAWTRPDGTRETFTEVAPVLAIEARLCSDFSRPHRLDNFSHPATAAGLERDGWTFEGSDVCYDVVVLDRELGLAPGRLALGASNGAHQLVVCEWSPEEDRDRLAPVLAELAREAIEKDSRTASHDTAAAL